MNKVVASIFGGMLSFLHVTVIAMLGIGLYQYSKNEETFASILGPTAYDKGAVYALAILIFLFYVLFVGMLSTFVSINEHLEEIKNKLDRVPQD
jgi:hypothetical protein